MTILLVDDNEISLELQKLMLESYGLPVDTATSGEAAIALANETDYSIIFMDIQMDPGMDGFTAAKTIRQFNANVPIIALSADRIARDDERFLESGMTGALQKPLQLVALKDLLSTYLELAEDNHARWRRKSDIIFDADELMSLLNDERAMKQILHQFLSTHVGDGERLRDMLAAGRITEARALLHELIGIAGNLYCSRLYEVATRLSAEIRSNVPYDRSLEQFLNTWQLTIGQLSERCNALSSKYKQQADDGTDWETLWEDFCELCRDFDMTATGIFNKNDGTFAAHLSKETYEALRVAVNQYDYLAVIAELEGGHV